MITLKKPEVYFSAHAFQKSVNEAENYYQRGLRLANKPWETAMYPLAHLVLKNGIYKCPLEYVDLEEIERIVVINIAIPPDKFKQHGFYFAKHSSEEYTGEEMNYIFKKQFEKMLDQFPLIGIFSKQHSHHYFTLTSPSKMDMRHNILKDVSWFKRQGLDTMFSMIMTKHKDGWRINANALGKDEKNVKLGVVKIVSNSHAFVKETRKQPYYNTSEGAEWCDENKLLLKKNDFNISRNFLMRGWRRYIIMYRGVNIVIAIPPFFPEQHIKVFRLIELRDNNFLTALSRFEELPVPENWLKSNSYNKLCLVELANYYKKMFNL